MPRRAVPAWRAFLRGMTRRCPRCGAGKLFVRWFRMKPECPGCGMRFVREEGFFLGAFVVNFALTEAVLGAYILAVFVATLPDPPVLLLAAGGAVVSFVVPLVAYPFSKTLWAALDLLYWPARDR